MKLKTLVAALSMGAVFSSAHALNNTPASTPAGSGFRITFGSNGTPLVTTGTPTVSAGSTTGEALIRDMFKAPGPAGKTLDLTALRSVPWGTIARGLARFTGWVGAAIVAYDIYDRPRVKREGDGFVHDAGQGMTPQKQYCISGKYCAQTPSLAYRALLVAQLDSYNGYNGREVSNYGTCSETYCSGGVIRLGLKMDNGTFIYQYAPQTDAQIQVKQADVCPAVPGATNPAYQVPGGAPGPDGKCPTGNYQPLTVADAEKLFEKYAPKEKAADITRELIESDAQLDPAPQPKVSGPAKVQGEPRVTTETDAQGNTKTTTKTDVYNITYNGDSYTWNTTTITTTPDGTVKEEPKEDEQVTAPADPDLPDVPKLYEQKYQNGLAGVWNDNSAALRQAPIFAFLASLNPNLGDGGCPVWSFSPGTVLKIPVAGDVSVPCGVWSFLRVFMVICALLACRRLIFGG